jgi:hypothetical protein
MNVSPGQPVDVQLNKHDENYKAPPKVYSQETVVPDQLCSYCKAFVSQTEWLYFSDIEQLYHWKPLKHVVDHYPSVETLVHSAAQGCHFCSVVLDCLRSPRSDFGRDMPEDEILQFKEKPVLSTIRVQGIYPLYEMARFGLDFHTQTPEPFKFQGSQVYIERTAQGASARRDQSPHAKWSTSTGSDLNLQMVGKWIRQCQSSHPDCSSQPSFQRPTRLLDLNAFDNSLDIRIVNGHDTGDQPYATLSYCWGLANHFTLTKSNYKSLKACIELHSLPKTLKDAVVVCRGLGIRYLWIDALCIIQGVGGDWNEEATKMHLVYAGCVFTIAAADAKDAAEGFVKDRKPLALQDCRISVGETSSVSVKSTPFCLREGNCPTKCRLDTRGWVMQERFLSPRTIYFGREGIHWECRRGILCEYHPDFEDISWKHSAVMSKPVYLEIQTLTAQQLRSEDVSKPQRAWNEVLKVYTATSLSHEQDKLIAISGIASVLQTQLCMGASFGLWLPFFLTELLWTTTGDQERLQRDGEAPAGRRLHFLPSWSWASLMNVQLENAHVRLGEGFVPQHMATPLQLPPATPFSHAGSLPSPSAPHSAVKLKGKLCECRAAVYGLSTPASAPELPLDLPIPLSDDPDRDNFPINRLPPVPKVLPSIAPNIMLVQPVPLIKFAPNSPPLDDFSPVCTFAPDLPLEGTTPIFCLLIARHQRLVTYKPVWTERYKFDYDEHHVIGATCVDLGLALSPTDNAAGQYRRVGIFTEASWFNSPPTLFSEDIPEAVVEVI